MLKETIVAAGALATIVGKHSKKIAEELLVPLAWGLITWSVVESNPRGWAASTGLFIIVYLGLRAYAASLPKKEQK